MLWENDGKGGSNACIHKLSPEAADVMSQDVLDTLVALCKRVAKEHHLCVTCGSYAIIVAVLQIAKRTGALSIEEALSVLQVAFDAVHDADGVKIHSLILEMDAEKGPNTLSKGREVFF